jgi:predicted nucleic acid-binding protein
LNAFIDSGGWISIIDEGDAHHGAGTAYLGVLMDLRVPLLTTDFVLDEVVTRIRYDVGHAKAAEFLILIRACVARGILEVASIGPDLWSKAEAIFLRYRDARLSFTDCTSFALLAERPADEVFGFDAHFEMMGHVLQPKGPG